MRKTIGKNTLGDGKKMGINLRDYGRSTHNLSYVWRNTQAPGTLVPFMKILAMPGDTFDIDIESHILTHPTIGPLFGSYKFQADVFVCPIRLYNALLHNNALNIGLNIANVKFPKFAIATSNESRQAKWNNSSLFHYLGFKAAAKESTEQISHNKYNAIPAIAYYDIFKNFYANKQEENFYTIGKQSWEYWENPNAKLNNAYYESKLSTSQAWEINFENIVTLSVLKSGQRNGRISLKKTAYPTTDNVQFLISETEGGTKRVYTLQDITLGDKITEDNGFWRIPFNYLPETVNYFYISASKPDNIFKLNEYKLTDIDDVREKILELGAQEVLISSEENQGNIQTGYLKDLTSYDSDFFSKSAQYGLVLKTYQSDLYNNWIKTDWIDGENGINAITAVDVSDGKLELDTLILAKKVYNMLNRIAISGGTYNDWVETVYSTSYINRSETPEYQGGMSSEIQFQEVISNSAAEGEPLGTLAGRGVQTGKKGGKITVKITEPAYLIGLCSITPRVDYSQGNDFDIMLDNLDQIHKPELDAIGFQDLQTWKVDAASLITINGVLKEYSLGKQPAWIDYMTAVNQTHGNFAVGGDESFMVLNRIFETTWKENVPELNSSTYVDPAAYNYVFADTDYEAMNFWVQMGIDIKARRKMSAKMMPTL
jgi:hypothetical protein